MVMSTESALKAAAELRRQRERPSDVDPSWNDYAYRWAQAAAWNNKP